MISAEPTIARLQEAGFGSVEGVLEFVAQTEAPRISPALFVVPERDTAQPNRMAGVHDQKVTETFSVVLVVKGARLAGRVREDLKQHSEAIVRAVAGWRHPEAAGACDYVGGRLLSAEAQHVAWAISFSASRHIRKESQ